MSYMNPVNKIEELFYELLKKHKTDRYQTPELSLIKLQEEVGELCSAWLEEDYEKTRKEAGDVLFALQGFVRIWNIDLIQVMKEIIEESGSKVGGKH